MAQSTVFYKNDGDEQDLLGSWTQLIPILTFGVIQLLHITKNQTELFSWKGH